VTAAADVITAQASVVLQSRQVVPLRSWMATGDRALQIVTPATSRLSAPLALRLCEPGSCWAVSDAGGYYDGFTGLALLWDGERFAPDPESRTYAPRFLGGPSGGIGQQVAVTFTVRHGPQGVFGEAIEAFCHALCARPPAGWGPAEPAGLRWDRSRFTDVTRGRYVRAVVVADDVFAASVSITPQADGGHLESATLFAGHADGKHLIAGVVAALPGLVSVGAEVRPGRSDLTVEPCWLGEPVQIDLGRSLNGGPP
jgi:hypothetical protein